MTYTVGTLLSAAWSTDDRLSVNPMQQDGPHTTEQGSIKKPPDTVLGVLSHLGPSMILSASVVGSGELIMTTTLGAQAGFVRGGSGIRQRSMIGADNSKVLKRVRDAFVFRQEVSYKYPYDYQASFPVARQSTFSELFSTSCTC